MDNKMNQRSPLSDTLPVEGIHRLSELPLSGKINLRGDSSDVQFCKIVETVMGLSLPFEANSCVSNNNYQIFWLGPDEWLIHLELQDLDTTISALRSDMESIHHAITDVSDYFTVIELSGPKSRKILASGTPLDVREPHFKPGQCAQTLFGHASILLWPHRNDQRYRLQVRWSYAQYLYTYLEQSIQNAEALATFENIG